MQETLQASTLEGSIDKVVYHDPESGFAVMRVSEQSQKLEKKGKGRDKRALITVLGKLPRVTGGEQFTASGSWEDSEKFGKQFRAEKIETKPPSSVEGMERYLGSGLISGVGGAYAKRIVDYFREDTFEVIEKESARLQEVEGIGAKRRKQIKQSWQEQKEIHRIMLFLHEHEVSSGLAMRIFRNYEDQAMEVLQKNPYQLIADMDGVGFRTADSIAMKLGLEADSARRIEAAVLHVLQEAARSGHCALPLEQVSDSAAEILERSDLSVGESTAAFTALEEQEHLVRSAIAGVEHGFLSSLYRAEMGVVKILQERQSLGWQLPAIDVEKALAWVEEQTGTALAKGQKKALQVSLTEATSIITGGPGVGKTTVLNSVLRILLAKKVEVVLAAPTGRAAKRLSQSTGHPALTLHRLLEYSPAAGFARNGKKPLEGQFFVIDEVSMVDIELFYRLLLALPKKAHLLLVGDADQLPSVAAGNVLGDLIASDSISVAALTEIFRQAQGSRIISGAHEVNEGRVPELATTPETESDFYFIQKEEPEDILAVMRRLLVERLPDKFGIDPLAEVQVLSPLNRGQLGTVALNSLLQNVLNPPAEGKWEVERGEVIFRVGDKVIQTRNNYDEDVYNGDMGRVYAIHTDPFYLEVAFEEGQQVRYENNNLDQLQLAYAITIHRSQGSEFPVVILPLSSHHYVMLQRKLLYTGITRARQLVIIIGQEKALSMAVNNSGGGSSQSRITGLLEKLKV